LAFTVGADAGYVIVSFWLLATIATLGAIPVFWLVEMEGFGGGDDDSGELEVEDETEDDMAAETSATVVTAAPTGPTAYISETALVDEPDEVPDDLLVVPTTSGSTRHCHSRGSLDLRTISRPIGLGLQGVIAADARR
jgi:hypothetical protein